MVANMHALENLIPLVVFRPLRLFITSENLRTGRIIVLKITHAPFVAIISTYEALVRYLLSRQAGWPSLSRAQKGRRAPSSYARRRQKNDGSRSLGSWGRSEAPLPNTHGPPISSGGGPRFACATHVDSVLKSLVKTLDDMEQSISQLADSGQNLYQSSKNDLVAQIRWRKQQWQKLRTMAENEEEVLQRMLAEVDMLAAHEQESG